MFVHPTSEVRLGSPSSRSSWGPPPPTPQAKSEESESESNSNSDPTPLELDLALALTPPPAVRRQTAGRRSSRRIRAPSPVSCADPRVMLPPRQQREQPRANGSNGPSFRHLNLHVGPRTIRGRGAPSRHEQQQEEARNLHAGRQDRAAASHAWNGGGIGTTMLASGAEGALVVSAPAVAVPAWPGTDPTDPFHNGTQRIRRSASTTSTAHASNGPAGQLSQLELQRALLRGEVPMGFGADASEGIRRQRRRDADPHRSQHERHLQRALFRGDATLGVGAEESESGRQRRRRGANVIGYCPPSSRIQAEARNWAALLAEYPAPGELATAAAATSASGE